MNKTAENWINLVWSASIYYPTAKNPCIWSDAASFILDVNNESELEGFQDSAFGTATQAFCFRPDKYVPLFPKSIFKTFFKGFNEENI